MAELRTGLSPALPPQHPHVFEYDFQPDAWRCVVPGCPWVRYGEDMAEDRPITATYVGA